MTFEPGQSVTAQTIFTGPRAEGVWPKGGAERLELLRERSASLHRLLPTWEERSEANTAKAQAEQHAPIASERRGRRVVVAPIG
jgi:hypothetical protein